MKVLVVLALLAVVANASVLSELGEKIVPRFIDPFIIKGENAKPHSAPYIVSLSTSVERHSHICGASIIAKSWVLTAAHCIKNPVGMSVLAGLHKRLDVDKNTQQRVVDFGRVHEKYTGGVGPYDIAILHVSEPFVFNLFVQPIVLPDREQTYEGTGALYGWGMTNAFLPTSAKTLQTVKVDIVNYEECAARTPDNAPLDSTNVCSDSKDEGISACSGDSGGPFVVEHEDASSELVGIVSWGYIPCGLSNMPSVYTRVSAYIDWIAKIQNAYYTLF